MDGEVSVDEARTGEDRIRVDMFFKVLDQICMQLKVRFDSEQTEIFHKMAFFANSNFKINYSKKSYCAPGRNFYSLASDAVALEFSDFCGVFSCSYVADQG